jgi:hypothetical protein
MTHSYLLLLFQAGDSMSTVMAAAAAAAAASAASIILEISEPAKDTASSHADSPLIRKADLPSKPISSAINYSNNTTNNNSNSSSNLHNTNGISSCQHSSSSSCSSFSTGTVGTTAQKKDRDSGHFTFIVSNTTSKKIDVDNVKKSFLRTQSFGVSLPDEQPSFSAFKRGSGARDRCHLQHDIQYLLYIGFDFNA